MVVSNRSCCHGNYENVKYYLSIKIFHQYIFHLPSFSLWAATFLLSWFGKLHILTDCQNCVKPPYAQWYLLSICSQSLSSTLGTRLTSRIDHSSSRKSFSGTRFSFNLSLGNPPPVVFSQWACSKRGAFGQENNINSNSSRKYFRHFLYFLYGCLHQAYR